jgi:hypothetical protein
MGFRQSRCIGAQLNKLIWFLCTALLLTSYQICADVLLDEQIYRLALQGYCSTKRSSHNFLLSTSTPLPKREQLGSYGANAPNVEAFNDMYSRNKGTTALPSSLACDRLEVKSKEEILEGFNTKPKLAYNPILTDENWAGFSEKFPSVSGIVEVSAPGYSKDGRYAIIYMQSMCGILCGYADFHQFKNVDGAWIFDKNFFVSQS